MNRSISCELQQSKSCWPQIQNELSEKWQGYKFDFSSIDFLTFTLSDWQEFQDFLTEITGDYSHAISAESVYATSGEGAFYDTIETLSTQLQEVLNLHSSDVSSIPQLLAIAGTLAKLPYGPPNSGESLSFWREEKEAEIAAELEVIESVKPSLLLLRDGQFEGDLIKSLDMLSDFGKTKLILFYLLESKQDLPLPIKQHWAPVAEAADNRISSLLVSLAWHFGLASEIGWDRVKAKVSQGELSDPAQDKVINPRLINFLFDESRSSAPWWMEVAFWHDLNHLLPDLNVFLDGEKVKELLNTDTLRTLMDNSLNSDLYTSRQIYDLFMQDEDVYMELREHLQGMG